MAVSSISRVFAGEAFYTAIAGVATKGVGSGFRVWDDRNAPSPIKRNTLKRESLTLAQVSVYTYLIDLAMQKLMYQGTKRLTGKVGQTAQALIQKTANRKILLKAIPVSAGIFLAETLGRKLAPRDLWSECGKLNASTSGTDGPSPEEEEDDDDAAWGKPLEPEYPFKPLPKTLPLTFARSPVPAQQLPQPALAFQTTNPNPFERF